LERRTNFFSEVFYIQFYENAFFYSLLKVD